MKTRVEDPHIPPQPETWFRLEVKFVSDQIFADWDLRCLYMDSHEADYAARELLSRDYEKRLLVRVVKSVVVLRNYESKE